MDSHKILSFEEVCQAERVWNRKPDLAEQYNDLNSFLHACSQGLYELFEDTESEMPCL